MESKPWMDLIKFPEGSSDGQSLIPSIRQCIQKKFELEQNVPGTFTYSFFASELETTESRYRTFGFEEAGTKFKAESRDEFLIRAFGCFLIFHMPSEGLRETFEKLVKINKFYSLRRNLLPLPESNQEVFTSLTSRISVRDDAIFAP